MSSVAQRAGSGLMTDEQWDRIEMTYLTESRRRIEEDKRVLAEGNIQMQREVYQMLTKNITINTIDACVRLMEISGESNAVLLLKSLKGQYSTMFSCSNNAQFNTK